jgi:hypothetical protein
MTTARVGGIALSIFAVATVSWFILELTPPLLGFADTDDPAVSLRFLREHPTTYAFAGLALFVMAGSLLVGALALGELMAAGAGSLAARVSVATAFVSVLFFFGHGVLRNGVGPLLYIDSLNPDWGESAYLVHQMAGLHGFAQGGIVAFSAWAVVVSLVGLRAGFIPKWVTIMGVLPAFRLLTSLLGPFGVFGSADLLWPFFMASIVGSMLWPLGLGGWLVFGGRARQVAAAVA